MVLVLEKPEPVEALDPGVRNASQATYWFPKLKNESKHAPSAELLPLMSLARTRRCWAAVSCHWVWATWTRAGWCVDSGMARS
jgi:hypothetical protein